MENITEKTRYVHQEAKLSRSYWDIAVKISIHFNNRHPTKAVMGVTPQKKWSE